MKTPPRRCRAAYFDGTRIILTEAVLEDIAEQLKAVSQMMWLNSVNNICACVGEITYCELIYN